MQLMRPLLTAALIGLLSATPVHANIMYEISILGDLPGGGTATGGYSINNIGQAVGISHASTGWRATLWDNGSIIDLGDLPGGSDYSVAMGINDAGQIAGISYSVNYRAVLWQNGTIIDLGTLSGTLSEAHGINRSGQVVGSSYAVGGTHAFVWENGSMTDLGTLHDGGASSVANAINDAGQIVGSGGSSAFLWEDGVMTDLGTLAGGPGISNANAINNAGQIVGLSYKDDTTYHAVLWINGVIFDLGDLPGGEDRSKAVDINSQGQIVGMSSSELGFRGVLWDGGSMTDLNDLIDPLSGWRIEGTNAINDRGQILGWGTGYGPNGVLGGFSVLLDPISVPEPATNSLVLIGLGLLGLLTFPRVKRSIV